MLRVVVGFLLFTRCWVTLAARVSTRGTTTAQTTLIVLLLGL